MARPAWDQVVLGDVTAESRRRAGGIRAFMERPVYGVDRSVGLTPVAKYAASTLERYKTIDRGMFAYNPMRLNIGSIGYCSRDTNPGLVSPDYVVFECDDKRLDPDFLNYYVGSPAWRAWTAKAGVGSVRTRIYYAELARLPLSLPPPSEQHAIAGFLRALDEKIGLNRRMNGTLDSIAQVAFRKRFEEDDGSSGWRKAKLSEICTTQYGYTDSASRSPVGPSFLRITDINKEGWIDWATVPYCRIGDEEYRKYKLEPGDVLVSRMADPGKAGIVEEDTVAVFASYLVRLKFNDLAWAYFAYYFLRSKRYLEYAERAKGGSVQSGMNAKVITGVDINLPPDERIQAFFAVVRPLRERILANLRESGALRRLRDAVLPKLMSGEVQLRPVQT